MNTPVCVRGRRVYVRSTGSLSPAAPGTQATTHCTESYAAASYNGTVGLYAAQTGASVRSDLDFDQLDTHGHVRNPTSAPDPALVFERVIL